ncbi:50S ribosomal protein L21, partial [Alphaproteobacteria bacterium]|nr:50S ribosomal protein L21 [Alphaproteobacteria bacterium]
LSAEEGEQIILNDIVMLGDGDKVTIGTPLVDGAGVSATVVRQTRGPKIIIFRRKRRKNHRRTQGHRQDLTLLKINDIAEDAKSLKTAKPAAKAAPKIAAASDAPAKKGRRTKSRRREKSCTEGRRCEKASCKKSRKKD